MKTLFEFVQKIVKDLGLDSVAPTMRKALELQVGSIVDKQIENALASTLTDDDWKFYDDYRQEHPEASDQEVLDAMLGSRPEIKKKLETTLENTYEDIIIRGMAVDQTFKDHQE